VGKFLSVKLIVFFCFWQGIIISLLGHSGVIQGTGDYSKEDVSMGIKDFLICLEMAGASLGHKFFFSYKDFEARDMKATKVRTQHAAAVDDLIHEQHLEGLGMGDQALAEGRDHRVHHVRRRHHPVTKALIDMLPVDVFVDAAFNIKNGMRLLMGKPPLKAVESMSIALPPVDAEGNFIMSPTAEADAKAGGAAKEAAAASATAAASGARAIPQEFDPLPFSAKDPGVEYAWR
jgi:hypothetical protein